MRVELELDHNVAALESIITVPDEELGPLKMQNVLFRMLGTPGRVRWSGTTRISPSSDSAPRTIT